MKKFLAAILLAMLLCGCSSGNDNSVTGGTICKYGSESDQAWYVDEIYAKGDTVQKMVYNSYTKFGETGYTEEDLQTQVDMVGAAYNAIEGLLYEASFEEGEIIHEIITIDFTKADFNQLAELEIIESSEINVVSLKMTLEGLNQEGFTCE